MLVFLFSFLSSLLHCPAPCPSDSFTAIFFSFHSSFVLYRPKKHITKDSQCESHTSSYGFCTRWRMFFERRKEKRRKMDRIDRLICRKTIIWNYIYIWVSGFIWFVCRCCCWLLFSSFFFVFFMCVWVSIYIIFYPFCTTNNGNLALFDKSQIFSFKWRESQMAASKSSTARTTNRIRFASFFLAFIKLDHD